MLAYKLGFVVVFFLLAGVARCDGLLPPLTEAQVRQARKLLADFKANPKGPYLQIRWFCKDGTVHPPSPPPCASRGGGNQHAELSPAALRLAAWNLDTGTILAGLSFEQFFDAKRDHHLLKELVLEKYLVEVDQGWIYRRARYYRGARQVEDEEKTGRRLLIQLLSDRGWVSRNYFLTLALVGTVPHGAPDSAVLKIRALAKTIADRDARFSAIRSKIHSTPGPDDVQAVEKFLAERNAGENVRGDLAELANLLRQQQTNQNLKTQLPVFQKKLAGSPLAPALASLAAALEKGNADGISATGAALVVDIRQQVAGSTDGRRNLDLLDLAALVLENGFQTETGRSVGAPSPPEPARGPAAAQGGRPTQPARRWRLANLLDNIRYATGAGLLSMRQLEALRAEIAPLERAVELEAETYYQSIYYLARATEWCRATVAKDFGPVVWHYEVVEPAAAGLVDQLVRGSMALPLSARLDALVTDANRMAGIQHSIFGEPSSGGVVGLNPGVALGRLGIVKAGQEDSTPIDSEGIYVIPETLADLKPMAGILTLDSGNALSHAQLLAANLGIPNAAIPSRLLPLLQKHVNQDLFFAVTPRRVVVLQQKSGLSPAEQKIWIEQPLASKPRIDLDTGKLDLSEKRILALADLRASDAGVKAGPKAANLAQLANFFPEQVAPGLVIPFGIYYEHVNRVLDSSGTPLQQQIVEAFREAERMRQTGAGAAEIGKYIYPRLERFRRTIETMQFLPEFEKELLERMRAKFGADGTYGVFVRSDTNAEDLPEFTGAGLNLTVPNQVGRRDILQSIKDVWASPFTERAYDWRGKILRSSEHVYPSVVLLRTVPSDKSGVIGTMNLETGNTDETTVNVSEGISAVVDGRVAESLLLKPDGTVRLLEQDRSPYKKVVLAAGGLENRPSSGEDSVLAPEEISQVRKMVAEVKARYPRARTDAARTLPWDIEFGFEKGRLRLFQIRPLVRYQELKTLEALSKWEARAQSSKVRLDEEN